MATTAANSSGQATRESPQTGGNLNAARARRPLVATLDPLLFMAARRGDSRQLKDLLRLEEDDEQGTQSGVRTAADDRNSSVEAVVVQVDVDLPHAAPAPAPAPAPHSQGATTLLLQNGGVTVEEDSLLHAAAASGHEASLAEAAQDNIVEAHSQVHDAVSPPLLQCLPKDDGVTIDGDSLLHVVAACGDSEEFHRCARMIARYKEKTGGAASKRQALEARNSNGHTPLHCAAGAGNGDMISCLADLAAGCSEDEGDAAARAFVRLQDECGETALHLAVVHPACNKLSCVSILMAIDPELACITRGDGASPLYLAISTGEMEVARHLFYTAQGNLSYSGPGGANVLHAAVYRGQALSMVLEWLRSMSSPIMAGNIQQQQAGQEEQHVTLGAADLLSKLTSQRDMQQGGSTPLHLAVSSDWWDWHPVEGFLSRRFPLVWPASNSTAALLLDANISTAYEPDDYGLYPIHVAAKCGNLGVVKMLLQRCPDCVTLRDSEGRTFLHHAAYEARNSVVEHVCQTLHLMMILNAQDSKGDTALHSVIRSGSRFTFVPLFQNLQVRLDVANKDGVTPLDLSCSMLPSDFRYSYNPRRVIWKSLLHAGAPYGGGRPECSCGKHTPARDLALESKQLARKAQLMSVVTVLIATVTFAAAFTLPGGYRADDKRGSTRKQLAAAGTAVLARTIYFDSFILADGSAFACSIMATSILAYVGASYLDIHRRNLCYTISCYLLRSSTSCLVYAFCSALLAGLAPVDPWAASCVACLIIITYGCNIGMQTFIFSFDVAIVIRGSRNDDSSYVPASHLRREFFISLLPFAIIYFVPVIWD
ncbi:unnamed protein product [Urochloa humidicola]